MMDDGREGWLADTFVELADTLVADFDVVEFLGMLVARCAILLDGSEVGLAVANRQGRLQVLASSSERMRILELLEVQNNEGPCRDCYLTGGQILNKSVDAAESEWPHFAPMAREAGFQMLHAVPMRLRGQTIGAINIFDPTLQNLSVHSANMTQAFADVATIGILQERSYKDQMILTAQLAKALDTRVAIEQAKGVLAERLKISMDEGFGLLRGYARSNNLRLSDVAQAVTGGELPSTALVDDLTKRLN
jgi:hypothetical protein